MYKIFVVFIHFATIINIFASDHGSIVVNSGIHDVIHEHVSNNFTQGLIPSSNNDLMIYAFDVGQANFIALKKANKIVLMDCGSQNKEYLIPNDVYKTVFKEDSSIVAIYITHPHLDHYLYLLDMGDNSLQKTLNLGETTFCLGGTQEDWKDSSCFNHGEWSVQCKHVFFVNNDGFVREWLDGVTFHTFAVAQFAHGKRNCNKLSLLTQVTYGTKKALFLGDAEGDSINRLFLRSYNIGQFSYFFDGKCKAQIDSATNQLNSYITNN